MALPAADAAVATVVWRDGAGLAGLVHPDDLPRLLAEAQAAWAGGERRVRHADVRMRAADGGWRWWQAVSTLETAADGAMRCTSHAIDVTGPGDSPLPPPGGAPLPPPGGAGPTDGPADGRADGPGERRTMLRAALDSVPDLIFFKDPSGTFVGCNRAFAAFVGRPADAVAGTTDGDYVSPDQAAAFRDQDRALLAGGAPSRNEDLVRMPDGRTAVLETIKTVLFAPDGRPLGLVGVARDVTEQRRAQRALQESERRHATLLGNLPGMAYRGYADSGWSMRFVSDGCRRLTGYAPHELAGDTAAVSFVDLIHPDDRERVSRVVAEALRAGRRFTLNYRLIDREGRVKHVWEQGIGVADDPPDPPVLEGFISDITGLKEAEAELRASGETLRVLSHAVAQSPAAVVVADVSGAVRYINPRFAAMTGRPAAEVPDLDAFVRGFAGDGGDTVGAVWRALAAGEAWEGEVPAMRAGGTPYWAALTIAPVRDDAGRVVNVIGTASDVTGRRQAEENLRRAQKMQAVGVLAGGVAHDFNNILTAILGYSLLALEEVPEGAPAREELRHITAAANRAKDLVRQLLAFSRTETVGRQPVDLGTVVAEALDLVQPAVPPTVAVRFTVTGGPLRVLAAPSQIHQVVLNLCRNAIDAIGDGPGSIVITVSPATADRPGEAMRARLGPGRHACLSVADDGCGMGPATLERIFEPFFTTKAVDKGTGLGLAVVHGIVADHGGIIDVASRPGQGSTFNLCLPLYEETAARGTPPRRGGRGRVLLVDEDRATLGMTGRLLRSQGLRVVATATSRRALALFTVAPARYDLIVLVQRRTEQAWKLLTLARAFTASSPGTPILACGGDDLAVEGEAIHAAGVTRLVQVPLQPARFAAIALDLVAQRRAGAAGPNT